MSEDYRSILIDDNRYPSLLESSDVDGGSSVAVLTYVRVVLETLDYPDIIHLILSYLMNLPERPESPQSRAKRRQSLDLLSKAADVVDSPTPAIYSLADLIMTSLQSKSQQTVSATLRLVSTILRKHYQYSMHTLLKTVPVPSNTPTRTIGAHLAEMEMLFQMASDLTGHDKNSSASYDDHIKDCQNLLEGHPCTTKFLGLRISSTTSDGRPADDKLSMMHLHTLLPNDPFLRHITDLFSSFFSNTVETNLVLTSVLIDLAACAYMRPEGWLFHHPDTYAYPEDSESDAEEDELESMENELAAILGDSVYAPPDSFESDRRRVREIMRARRHPEFTSAPPVMEVLQSLVSQVADYRKEVPDLDDKLMERRRAFEFTEELSEAVSDKFRNPLDAFTARNLVRPTTAKSLRPRGLSRVTQPEAPSSPFENHIADTTHRRLKVLVPGLHKPPPKEDEDGDAMAALMGRPRKESRVQGEVSLSHLLTNIMILQVSEP
jgi:hypothetical protein